MELKIIGVRGYGVIWETDIDERCNEDDYCEFDIWWLTNFELSNGKCIFRKKIEHWYGEDGSEDVDSDYKYYYIKDSIVKEHSLNCIFKEHYVECDENGKYIEVSKEIINLTDELWDKLEMNDEDLDIDNDCGFDYLDETEIDNLVS